MLVVTNQVLPCVTYSNKRRYDTTRQRFHFVRGLLDFFGLVVTNFGRITDLNGNLRKLQAPSKTAYLSHSWFGARRAANGADSGAQTPPEGGVSVGNSCGTQPPFQYGLKSPFRSKKRGGEK